MAQPDKSMDEQLIPEHEIISQNDEKSLIGFECAVRRKKLGKQTEPLFVKGFLSCMEELDENTPKNIVDYYLRLIEDNKSGIDISVNPTAWDTSEQPFLSFSINGGNREIKNKQIADKLREIIKNKTGASITEQNRTEQNRTEQDRTGRGIFIRFRKTEKFGTIKNNVRTYDCRARTGISKIWN